MNKQKQKIAFDFLDVFTMKKLKVIVLICLIMSFFCEFFSDVVDLRDTLENFNFINFFQSHKDYFVNIVLGCLCSAVISYVLLCIPRRLKEIEKKEMIEKYYIDIIKVCLFLNSIISDSLDGKTNNRIDAFKDILILKNIELKNSIEKFLYQCKETEPHNTKYDVMIELCNNKLLPIVIEIKTFCDCLKALEDIEMRQSENLKKEIQFLLYKRLNNEYNFESVIKDIINIVAKEHLPLILLNDILDTINENSDKERILGSRMFYYGQFDIIYKRIVDEKILNDIKDLKVKIIKYVDEHMDSFGYGNIIKVNGEKMYRINEKIMEPKEYREYCINIELKKRGLN